MHILLWLLVGAMAGWIAAVVMKDAPQGMLMNVVVGVAGSYIGGAALGTGSAADPFTLRAFLVAVVGAIVLLAVVNLARRGRVR